MDEQRGTEKTAELGRAVCFSRSRGKLCVQGRGIPGHVQTVHEIRVDCDQDVVLLQVTQQDHEPGIACHHRAPQLLFPCFGGRRLEKRRSGLERPGNHLQVGTMSSSDTPTALSADALARLACVIESRKPPRGRS